MQTLRSLSSSTTTLKQTDNTTMKLFPSPPHPTTPHFATLLAAYSSTPDAAAVSNLRSAADAMIASGHAKDCEAIYKAARKSAVDQSLKGAGFVAMSGHQLHRLDWAQLDRRIKLWLAAAAAAFRSTFPAERSLADAVFPAERALADSCYAAAVGGAADALLAFPELVAGKSKKSPERMFRFLDMHDLLAGLPTPASASAAAAKAKVGEAVRATLSEFESAIQHDDDKAAVPGGGLHPATRYVMNYVAFLADYAGALAEILGGGSGLPPLPVPASALISDGTEVSLRLSWIILVLLCKVDSKAELYHDVGLSYLFLCNNLHYVVNKVRSAAGLRRLLGEEWLARHEEKVQIYAANYQRIVWGPVAAAAAGAPPAASPGEAFGRFNGEFEGACRRQRGWVVAERKLRDEIKVSAARTVVPPYRELYRRHRGAAGVAVRFSPEDLDNHISDLFMGESPAMGPGRHDQVSS